MHGYALEDGLRLIF